MIQAGTSQASRNLTGASALARHTVWAASPASSEAGQKVRKNSTKK